MTSGVVRRGDRLLRPMGPWSLAVHEFLRHLEAAGFDGSPRVLGIEGDREALTYIDGEVAVDPSWQPGQRHRLPPYARTGSALRRAAQLIRKLHQAAAGFRSPATASTPIRPQPGRSSRTATSAPGTPFTGTACRSASSTGTPLSRSTVADLAAAAWTFVPLAPPEQLSGAGFDPPPDLAPRLRLFLDAYGPADRRAILPALQRCKLATAERIKYWTVSASNAACSLECLAQELHWLQDISPDLAAASRRPGWQA